MWTPTKVRKCVHKSEVSTLVKLFHWGHRPVQFEPPTSWTIQFEPRTNGIPCRQAVPTSTTLPTPAAQGKCSTVFPLNYRAVVAQNTGRELQR